MPLSRYNDMFEPDDLGVMQRVFDAVCKQRRLADKDQREALAADIVREFKHGLGEAELLQAMSKRHKR